MTLQDLIAQVLDTFINPLFPILVGFALILFMWGLVKYLKGGLGDKGDLDGAKSLMLWGVIVLFVMVSVWGLVKILQQTFFGGNPPSSPPTVPQFGGSGGGPTTVTRTQAEQDEWMSGDVDGGEVPIPNAEGWINVPEDPEEQNSILESLSDLF